MMFVCLCIDGQIISYRTSVKYFWLFKSDILQHNFASQFSRQFEGAHPCAVRWNLCLKRAIASGGRILIMGRRKNFRKIFEKFYLGCGWVILGEGCNFWLICI